MQSTLQRKELIVRLNAAGWTGPTSYVAGYSSQGKATLVDLLEVVEAGGDGYEYLAAMGGKSNPTKNQPTPDWTEIVAMWQLLEMVGS